MRIVVVGPTYPFRGGIEQHTTLVVRELRRQGHEVLFISFTRQYPKWLFPGKSDRDPSKVPLVESAEYLIDSINPLTWRNALKRIKDWQPEIVILPWWVTFWTPVWWYLGRGVKRIGAKLVFVVHNALPHEARWWDRRLLRLALGRGDRFVAHAESEARVIRAQFADRQVVVTAMPSFAAVGAEIEADQFAHDLDYPKDKRLLLFCGLIRPYKGLDLLLDALPLVLAAHDVHLAIVGEMWGDGSVYFEQIERLGLAEYVTVENAFVPDERLRAWVESAEIVVLPYRSATQSAVVQLALGLGTPVIVTRVGGLVEAVEDGVNGLLVEPEDVGALAVGITRFLNAPFLPQTSASQSLEWVHLTRSLII